MPAHNILVVVVDGLRASALGAYGNTTFPTSALDSFAADSFLLDWCYARSTELADIYRDLWQSDATSLPRHLKSLGYSTKLVTDEPALSAMAGVTEFDDHFPLGESNQPPGATHPASDTNQATLAHFFAASAGVIASPTGDAPKFIWLHSRGMYGPWDAPLGLQQSLLDVNDPPPVEIAAPPDLEIAAGDDPDSAFRYGCAYAAQVIVFDQCWEILLDALDSTGGDRWLVSLIGARGFPLGEHRRVGGIDPRLYGEQLQVPWMIRFPDAAGRLARCSQLTSHVDLAPSLVRSCEPAGVRALATDARTPWRDELFAASPSGHRAIRTVDWCLRQDPNPSGSEAASGSTDAAMSDVELFVRPDDRWEANDVAKLCPEVVESLARKLNHPS